MDGGKGGEDEECVGVREALVGDGRVSLFAIHTAKRQPAPLPRSRSKHRPDIIVSQRRRSK